MTRPTLTRFSASLAIAILIPLTILADLIGFADILLVLVCIGVAIGLLSAAWRFLRPTAWLTFRQYLLLLATLIATGILTIAALNDHAPVWVLPPALLILAATFYAIRLDHRRRLRWQRIQSNLCEACGYDLCMTQDRCPECGTPIPGHYAWYRRPEVAGMFPETGMDEDPPTPPPQPDAPPPIPNAPEPIWVYQPNPPTSSKGESGNESLV